MKDAALDPNIAARLRIRAIGRGSALAAVKLAVHVRDVPHALPGIVSAFVTTHPTSKTRLAR